MVTLATFLRPDEAHLLRMRLGAGGVEAWVQDEHLVTLDWFYALAIGGVRVQVTEEDLDAARELLTQDGGVDDYEPERRCPRCGSPHVEHERFSRRLACCTLAFPGIPLVWPHDRLRCDRCLLTWKLGNEPLP